MSKNIGEPQFVTEVPAQVNIFDFKAGKYNIQQTVTCRFSINYLLNNLLFNSQEQPSEH